MATANDSREYDRLGDCATCNGHRWQMWRTKNALSGNIQPELRSCPVCNEDGKKPPPIYEPPTT